MGDLKAEAKAVRGLRVPEAVLRGDRFGQMAARIRNLGKFLLLSLVANVVLAGMSVWQAGTAEVETVVLSVDRFGEIRYEGTAGNLAASTEQVGAALIRDWVGRVRTVTPSVSVQDKFVEWAGAHTTGDALSWLQIQLETERNPYHLARRQSVDVDVDLPIAFGNVPDTFQVSWEEVTRNGISGGVEARTSFQAVISLSRGDQTQENLVGLYVETISLRTVGDDSERR